MKDQTLARNNALSRPQLRELRAELERERRRYAEHDPRFHSFTEALNRMDDGSFGACVACGSAIPYARLSVVPETLYCVACGVRS
jgi:RNA polymerase-binding transcription factor DksA